MTRSPLQQALVVFSASQTLDPAFIAATAAAVDEEAGGPEEFIGGLVALVAVLLDRLAEATGTTRDELLQQLAIDAEQA